MPDRKAILEVAGRTVVITNPDKVFFTASGVTKLDMVRYYLSVADGALRGVARRPMVLKRFVHGADGEAFFQKRAPDKRPDWMPTVTLSFPSGRTAAEIVVSDPAQLAWGVDLDPVPGIGWPEIRQVALVARDALADFGLTGWPKTSGSRGFHIYARIEPRWGFTDVRRAAVALAREIKRRAPDLATAQWWKEERHGVFVDYNQNAKDRTVASAYSVRPTQDARVSTPLTWAEVPDCDPAVFTLSSMPARFAKLGDVHAAINEHAGSLAGLLELFERQGLGDAPWPPHYRRQASEPPRVQPSRRRLPLLEIGRARRKEVALAGLERWKARHPQAATHLEPADVLVDVMRGRYSTWTRIRVNLQHVPEELRPVQEALDPDEKIFSSS